MMPILNSAVCVCVLGGTHQCRESSQHRMCAKVWSGISVTPLLPLHSRSEDKKSGVRGRCKNKPVHPLVVDVVVGALEGLAADAARAAPRVCGHHACARALEVLGREFGHRACRSRHGAGQRCGGHGHHRRGRSRRLRGGSGHGVRARHLVLPVECLERVDWGVEGEGGAHRGVSSRARGGGDALGLSTSACNSGGEGQGRERRKERETRTPPRDTVPAPQTQSDTCAEERRGQQCLL